MKNLSSSQFTVMASMIEYAYQHFDDQPTLEQMAATVDLSPSYAQRQFQEWVGISPKKFVQYLSLQRAKALLQQHYSTLDAALETGLSGTGRLHDLFIQIEGMTPGEYKQHGASLLITYSIQATPFGDVFIASTVKGICSIQFLSDALTDLTALDQLQQRFALADFQPKSTELHQQVAGWFQRDLKHSVQQKIPLRLQGTPFQLKVWEALLTIPEGQLRSYQQIAEQIGHHKAIRAVASAVANNPIAYLIPCHRVIRSTGMIGEYHWSKARKLALLSWEMAKQEQVV
ncbi:methylated-DNA--[protein]-cysteine S-methyltransferase [Acinetobacter sp. S40]|uniref:bifunctional transcriptional activator/DNA repair enzyme AdaA n=1 Tax=Acinetobacter sp. S40 TaxID=2767434 RepID=UPI00190B1DEB|nr:methylated-DNA--[protein]-cysteine S-methyltransferase [Acinetobacter sp. S40]MBJ9984104.1 methylated-DNA--[protein]-cysteine S-methyltransferase [Acinetobacter sp. S40]